MLAIIVVLVSLATTQAAVDGLARTPPMGWRDWNFFQGNITQDIMIRNMEVRIHARLFVAGFWIHACCYI